jgi:predicted nucleic acid-binding protein
VADFVDTNVFVYAHDRDAGDKHATAIELLARLARSGELTTSAQVVNELASVLHRKLRLDRAVVAASVATVCAHANVLHLTGELTALALGPGMDAGLSFWDALVWATARANGVSVVHTEDFTHGRIVDGVRFVDPFHR